MKYIKYLVSVLLFGATLTSCVQEVGTVGQTTVQFKDEQIVAGFGAEYIYVPIRIFGANADAMNTADVTLKVKVDDTYTSSDASVYVGKDDLIDTTEDVGDIRVTAYDLVFRNNYNIPEEDKNKPYYKDIEVEIMLLNKEPEVMEFKLVIEESNTTIGAANSCVVRLEKGPADRLCGAWYASYTGKLDLLGGQGNQWPSSWQTEMYYDDASGALSFYETVVGLPFVYYFNKSTEQMVFPTFEVLGLYQTGMYICQWVFRLNGDSFVFHSEDSLPCEYDKVNFSYVKTPDLAEWTTCPTVLYLDDAYNITNIAGWFHNDSLFGLGLTRTKPSGKAPAKAPSLDYAKSETTFVEATAEQNAAFLKAYKERFGSLKVNF